MQNTQTSKEEKWRERTLRVEGLDCADCARQLQEGICRLDGINECSLSYATGRLHLRYKGTLDKVYAMVKSHGYQLRESEGEERGEGIASVRVKQAVIAGISLAAAAVSLRFIPSLTKYLLLVTVLIGVQTTLRRGWQSLRQMRMDMNVLMIAAVIGALYIGEWWEGATVAFLFAASNALETYTAEKNRRSVRALMQEVPETAHRLQGDTPETVDVTSVRDGDTILVRPGERLPLDGMVMKGYSYVNEAAITGESMPVEKEQGSRVCAGTLNGKGSLTIRVSGTWQDSTLSKVVQLVEEAQERRVPAEQFVERFARVYTPLVIILAAGITIFGPFTAGGNWHAWLYRGLALLLVACPCSLVIAAPVSVAAALSNAARHGALIKGGAFLEALGTVKAVLFDKTGTLTKGTPSVEEIHSFGELSKNDILALAAGLEAHSEHILAEAVREKAAEAGIDPRPVDEFSADPGKGVTGLINGVPYMLGSVSFLLENGVAVEPLQELTHKGKTVIAAAAGQRLLGALLLSDVVRSDSSAVIRELGLLGIESIHMLTGDRLETAAPVAKRLGIEHVSAGLLPHEKEAAVSRIAGKWGKAAMVGDGINDAPALAAADVGIAMGAAGSPTALETADIALMGDELHNLPFIIRLSRQTIFVIRQNIALSLLIKSIAILLVFPGWLTLWMAIVADMGASLLVTLNGMRLLAYKK